MMKSKMPIFAAAAVMALPLWAAVNVIPKPVQVTEMAGRPGFTLTETTAIVVPECFAAEAKLAAEELRRPTGFGLPVRVGGKAAAGDIVFRHDAQVPASGYTFESDGGQAVIAASDGAGAFHGYQTLRQLLPSEVYAREIREGVNWTAPAVTIADRPRLAWRGLMIDDCRHFMGAEAVKAMIDAMAAYKFNTMHWHLTEDQGWRIEIRKYPEIIEKGAVRACSPKKWDRNRHDGTVYGPFYYTQEQIRDIVAYAAARHITIVPEIDMPGHMRALLSSHPELSCTGGPFVPRWQWGVDPDILCAGNDATLRMMEDILDEVMELFPSPYIHIGGDEAPKTRWDRCPKCQARIKAEGLKNSHELQTWFMESMARYLKRHGRNAIGWDEIIEGGLPEGTAVMSWRGARGGIAAAKAGHDVVMTPNTHLYLDYGQGIADDPYEYLGGNLPLDRVYAFDPVGGIPEAMHKHVVGVQGNLWSECIWDGADLQWKAWPRALAVAEIGWTPQAQRVWKDFHARAAANADSLKAMGLNAAPVPALPAAFWKTGDIPTEWVTRSWDVSETVRGAGDYTVTFRYTHGDSRIDLRAVSFRVNGTEAATDRHEGTAGGRHKGNVYRLTLKDLPADAKVELSAEVRTDGNDRSNGSITVVPVPQKR